MATPDQRLRKDLEALRDATDPLARLDAVRRVRERAEAVEVELVAAARAAGSSWTAIGALYGMSKQGAQQRFRGATKRRARSTESASGDDASRGADGGIVRRSRSTD
ncbi:MAG: hypothetical protein IPI32_14455 [Austwickia sp.]|nr:hypothetical protein [Austwickia sp.]MBK8435430.1 hypothetical protein [Austwickia sp.]MBK9101021.1 hypothetical protein [Austwickia sp.]